LVVAASLAGGAEERQPFEAANAIATKSHGHRRIMTLSL
jgi:hypothetical protein